jgi:galactokinase
MGKRSGSEGMSVDRALHRACAAFESSFHSKPTHSASAPGRINLIGEHTDYNGGLVLPAPIGLRCALAGSVAHGCASRLVAADFNDSLSFDPNQDLATYLTLPPPRGVSQGHWARYVLGVIDGYRRVGFELPGVDVAIASDIPIGAGLASSAALEAATASLIEAVTGRSLSPLDKARLCRTAEHTFAGVPCGIMDQFAVILGQVGQALLIDCSTQKTEAIPLPSPDKAIILVMDTGVRHALADGEYARRRNSCALAAKKLGLPHLSSTTLDHLNCHADRLTDEELRYARHVVTENARVQSAVEALRGGNLYALGKLMYASHESLRDDFQVSCAELDTLVDLARVSKGVFGARMTGAGFGGCAIALVEPVALEATTSSMQEGYERAHGKTCRVFAALRSREQSSPINPQGDASAAS